MTPRYLALYWTYPVPWLGFTRLPRDVDAAAAASRTIRFCRDLVRARVAAAGGEIVAGGEIAVLEIAPDRGSPQVGDILAGMLDRATALDAFVAIVDFSARHGWRGHAHLAEHYAHPRCWRIAGDDDTTLADAFDPYLHFEAWRQRTRRKIDGKPGHRETILAALGEMPGGSFPGRAAALNGLGLLTHHAKPWTADNLRKFLRAG